MKTNFILFLLSMWAVSVAAQAAATPNCYILDDVSAAGDDIDLEMDNLSDGLDEIMQIDEWDESEAIKTDGLRDAIQQARSDWGKMHSSLLAMIKDWNSVAPLAKKGCFFSKKYKKATKYLNQTEAWAFKGVHQLKDPLEKWSPKGRIKAMFDMKGILRRCNNALRTFTKMSSTMSGACEMCNPDPDNLR